MSQLTTDPAELSRMARRVMELKLEHRDLDIAIARLVHAPSIPRRDAGGSGMPVAGKMPA